MDMHKLRFVVLTITFELKPFVLYNWLSCLDYDFRCKVFRQQLLESQAEWGKNHGYEFLRFEALNRHRPMLHLSLMAGFDIVGTRWDSMRSDLLIQFEKSLIEDMNASSQIGRAHV